MNVIRTLNNISICISRAYCVLFRKSILAQHLISLTQKLRHEIAIIPPSRLHAQEHGQGRGHGQGCGQAAGTFWNGLVTGSSLSCPSMMSRDAFTRRGRCSVRAPQPPDSHQTRGGDRGGQRAGCRPDSAARGQRTRGHRAVSPLAGQRDGRAADGVAARRRRGRGRGSVWPALDAYAMEHRETRSDTDRKTDGLTDWRTGGMTGWWAEFKPSSNRRSAGTEAQGSGGGSWLRSVGRVERSALELSPLTSGHE